MPAVHRAHCVPAIGIPGIALLVIAAGVVSGCASTPAAEQPKAEAPSDLYAGEPATVHATEFPVTSAAEGVQRGDEAWRRGELDRAIYLYLHALRFAPNDASTLRKIGAIHESRGNRALARRAFEMALERGGEHAGTLERLGLLYLEDGANERAQALLARVVALEPGRWRAHNGLGVLADRRAEYAAARAHYEAALELEPATAMVLNNRGYSRYLAGDLAGAEADLLEAIRLGAAGQAWLNLGKVQAKARRYSVAFRSFLETLDTASAYNEVGEAALRNGDRQIAKGYFESAANASPSFFERAQKNLAIVNEELLNHGGADGS